MIYFLDDTLITSTSCEGTKYFPIFQAAKFVILLIQIAVPFALILWGSLDWFKALIARDEKEMIMKRKPFIARVIAAIIIMCLPWLIQLIAGIIAGKSETADFWTCYHQARPVIDFTSLQQNTEPTDDTIWEYTGPTQSIVCEDIKGVSARECHMYGCDAVIEDGKTSVYNCKSKVLLDNCADYKEEDSCDGHYAKSGDLCKWTEVNGGYTCDVNRNVSPSNKGYNQKNNNSSNNNQGSTTQTTDDSNATNEIDNDGESVETTECSKYTIKDLCEGSTDSAGNVCKWYSIPGGSTGYCKKKDLKTYCSQYPKEECDGSETVGGDICIWITGSRKGDYCGAQPKCTDVNITRESDCKLTKDPRSGKQCKWVTVSGGGHCVNP